MSKFNTTDNQYKGRKPALRAAQALANALRAKYTLDRDKDMTGDTWQRIFADEARWLDQIVVLEDWNGAPAVIWETDTGDDGWAHGFGFRWLEDHGHKGYYFEPYYSFAVQVFPI